VEIFFKIKGYLFNLGVLTLNIHILKLIKMKNSFKLGALALVIAVSFAACKGKSDSGSADSTVKVDSTVKKDSTVVKADTSKKDTTKKDTSKKM
jgi:hypothetical protein